MTSRPRGLFSRGLLISIALLILLVAAVPALIGWYRAGRAPRVRERPLVIQDWFYSWTELPRQVRSRHRDPSPYSNIAPADYVGPEVCGKCHQQNYQRWSQHPHRWMNAAATPETVKGRFDGSTIALRGGNIVMDRAGDTYWMRLQQGDLRREFRVTHTIGSRFLQYYIGTLEQGTEIHDMGGSSQARGITRQPSQSIVAPGTKLVLPVGYILSEDRWAPATEVFSGYDTDLTSDPYEAFVPVRYYELCAICHTTMPQGYRMLLDINARGVRKPPFHFELWPFFQETWGQMVDGQFPAGPRKGRDLDALLHDVSQAYGPERAITLGISCEACHYGGRAHVASAGKVPPHFFPSSPHLADIVRTDQGSFGRTQRNLNLACAQCHSTIPETWPGGASRRNSSEFRDAISGSCYSKLSCVDCHEPHTPTGPRWPKSPDQDDASCLACHNQYEAAPARQKHTHHPAGSDGARCMNCHMPKVTEGLLNVVRTHQISSPNNHRTIENGGPNACNVCHLDRSIDWTLEHLTSWYGTKFNGAAVARRYPDRRTPMGQIWLGDSRPEMRLVVLDAAQRTGARWLAPAVVDALDNPHVITRQFAERTLRAFVDMDLHQAGYDFWQTPKERAAVLDKLRTLVSGAAKVSKESETPDEASDHRRSE